MRIEKVFMGITLIFMGLALLMIASAMHSANVQYGGVIIIGPFPIVFGSSPGMALFGVMFAIVILLMTLMLLRW